MKNKRFNQLKDNTNENNKSIYQSTLLLIQFF